jgi:hypothetical protein
MIFSNNNLLAVSILVLMTPLLSPVAHGEDVYNFYFQKKPGKNIEAEKEEPLVEDEEDVEVVEEVAEEEPEVLLVPDNWRSGKYKKKKVYIRRNRDREARSEERERGNSGNRNTKLVGLEKLDKKKRWAFELGVGGISGYIGSSNGSTGSQSAYVLGGRYLVSKYFDINMAIYSPTGTMEGGCPESAGWGGWCDDGFKTRSTIGLGVTPIHLSFFGHQFLEIGLDGGVIMGKVYDGQGREVTTPTYLAPRLGVNFSDKFSMHLSTKISSAVDSTMSNLSVAYRW